MQLSQFIKNIK